MTFRLEPGVQNDTCWAETAPVALGHSPKNSLVNTVMRLNDVVLRYTFTVGVHQTEVGLRRRTSPLGKRLPKLKGFLIITAMLILLERHDVLFPALRR